MSASNSTFFVEPPSPDGSNDIDSLPSTDDASSSEEDEHYISDAERQWRESLEQFELLATMVLIPYIGKYFGRKFAFWGWGKFMEWKYPVEMVVTDSGKFKGAGVVAAASL